MIARAWQFALGRRSLAYAGLCLFLFSAACLIGLWSGRRSGVPFNAVRTDGQFYYVYLPSILVDGDLNFANQMEEHWGKDEFLARHLADRTPTGLIHNQFPIGFALTLVPAFLVGHIISLLSFGVIPADGYSWPYQVLCLAWIEFLLWRTLVRMDWILIERLRLAAAPAMLGLFVAVLGTPCGYYATREPFMVHLVSLFWCTEVVWLAVGPTRPPRVFWPLLGLCSAMAFVCRPTNIFIFPLGLYGLSRQIRERGWSQVLAYLPLAGTALIPIALQMACWKILEGQWVSYSYREQGFDWTQPALFQTLFSSRHGLFVWSPIILLGVAALLWKRREPFLWCWMLGALLLWYANSSWYCWWFGHAFGARAFLELTGLFAIGLASLFEALGNSPKITGAIAIFALSFNGVFAALYISQLIPIDGYFLPW
jgi:hypothetical protein